MEGPVRHGRGPARHTTSSEVTAVHVDEAIARFETQLQADNRSANTISSYLRDLRTFALWLRAAGRPRDVQSLTTDDVSAFLTSPAVTAKADGTPKAQGSIDKVKMSLNREASFPRPAHRPSPLARNTWPPLPRP